MEDRRNCPQIKWKSFEQYIDKKLSIPQVIPAFPKLKL